MTSVHELLAGASGWLWPMMLHHLWQAAWFAGFAWLLCLLARRVSAKTRYWVWLLALFKCALPAGVLALVASSLNLQVQWPASAVSQSSTRMIAEFPFTNPNQRVTQAVVRERSPDPIKTGGDHGELYCVLTLVWGAGSAFCLAVFSQRRRSLKTALRRGQLLISGRAVEALHRMRTLLKEKRTVGLIISSDLPEPGVWGVSKPVLVLPQGMVEALTDQELEAVMLHELVHVRRRDNLASAFQSWLCGLFWFYPVVWLIDRQLLAEREFACDEQVLGSTLDSQNYLSSLMKVFRLSLREKMAGVSLATGSNLKRRIDHMRSHHFRKNSAVLHRLMISGFALALTVSMIAAALLNQDPMVAQENSEFSRVAIPGRSEQHPTAALKGVETGARGGVTGGVEGGVQISGSGGANGEMLGGIRGGVNGGIPRGIHQKESVGAALAPGSDGSKSVALQKPVKQSGAEPKESVQLKGSVYDASRAAVPGAKVTLFNRETQNREITFTSDSGEYWFQLLPTGSHVLEVSKAGFQLFRRNEVLLNANVQEQLDIVLEVGELFETVEVTGKSLRLVSALPNSVRPPQRIRVGGNVQQSKLISTLRPTYPELAQQAGIEGTVLLEAIIAKDGKVINLRLGNTLGHPLLVQAAIEAVKQWFYEPTLLNGEPIEVLTNIAINFRLSP